MTIVIWKKSFISRRQNDIILLEMDTHPSTSPHLKTKNVMKIPDISSIESFFEKEINACIALPQCAQGDKSLGMAWVKASRRMSACGGIIRNKTDLENALQEVEAELENFPYCFQKPKKKDLGLFFRYREMLITQKIYLFSMIDYIRYGGKSRGLALYTEEIGEKAFDILPELFRFQLDIHASHTLNSSNRYIIANKTVIEE
ncbi:MAG: hypothetical protein E7244_20665 [Enterocloster citroniae]|nr:hypothetical protein [Enterocloster citroniae]